MQEIQTVNSPEKNGRIARQTFPSPFRLEGRRLTGAVSLGFEQFYRAKLRFVPGSRLKAVDVMRLCEDWSAEVGRASIPRREIKRSMLRIGHGYIHSNGTHYCDVGLAADFPDLTDNFPAVPAAVETHAEEMVRRLDDMITDLSSIRAAWARVVH